MPSTAASLCVPQALRCEYLATPLGLETRTPHLSWELPLLRRGIWQTAYQVCVASAPERLPTPDLWDSGRVASAQSVQVPYGGAALHSGQRCWWAVRVWDEQGDISDFSDPAWWEMGLLDACDWQGQWVGIPNRSSGDAAAKPAPCFRKRFVLEQPVVAARAYVCGLGYHEFYLNGQKVGDHVLDPAFTRYDVRSLYVVHDITDLLTPGENVVGALLGCGWYNCHTQEVWDFASASWRHQPKLLAQLHLTLADGSTRVIATDGSWKTATGPVVFDGLRNGETYDARLERPGWAAPGYDDTEWAAAEILPGPGGTLSAQLLPCRVMQTLTPVAMWEAHPGVYVFDMGQNMAGWAQLTVSGPAGTEVTLRYAERLTPERDIDQAHISCFIKSGEAQTDRYLLKGEGVEVWEPRFTYHGFQYVQVTGYPGVPTLDAVRGRVVHSAFASAGEFACSHELLNAIQRCTRWSYISNFVGIPTDCPHREKNGWTGDAMLAAETGLFNYAAGPAYRKWLNDFADVQRPSGQLPGIVPTGGWGFNWGSGPAWDSAYTHIPWYLYLYEGDLATLAEHYDAMKRYVDFMARMATDDIVSFGLGDWCAPHNQGGGGYTCPEAVTSTGYYYANCRILAQAAAVLGKTADAAEYAARAEQVQAAFNARLVDSDAPSVQGGDQTALACALFHGLLPAEREQAMLKRLVELCREKDWHAYVGILGAKYVLNTLRDHGRADVAYALATQTSYPSWGDWIAQGATTLWEAWEGDSSRNHVMFGDISAWCYKTLAGILPAAPGFKQVTIHPHPVEGLTWARGEHQTPYGRVHSAWQVADGRFMLDVEIPGNTTGRVILPAEELAGITEGDRPVAQAEGVTVEAQGPVTLLLASGGYRFTVPRPRILPAVGAG